MRLARLRASARQAASPTGGGEEVPCVTTEDGCVFFTAEYWAQPQPSLAPPQPAAATRPYDDGCWWEDGCDSWGGAS